MNRQCVSPLDNSSIPPELDPMALADGFVGHGDGEADYIRQMDITNDEAQLGLAHQSQSQAEHDDTPRPASGRFAEDYPANVAHILRKSRTAFDTQKEGGSGENPWAPFNDEDEWELARFLLKEVSQTAADKFLKLPIVSGSHGAGRLKWQLTLTITRQTKTRTQLSYLSNYKLLKKIDALPTRLEWRCDAIKVTGDVIGADGMPVAENVELWWRNPVDCVQDLIGNPAFRENLSYVPQKVFTTGSGTTRIYDEAWTGDWWWMTQVSTQLPLITLIDANTVT
jgi:hypothetical protein